MSTRRIRFSRRFGFAVVLIIALLSAGTAFATGYSPLRALLAKGREATARHEGGRIGIEDATALTPARAHSHRGGPSTSTESTVTVTTSKTSGGDTTPPDTTITSGPAATTTATSTSFSFVSSEANSTFACKLDGGKWSRCRSPRGYTGLSIGSHTFSVRAKDAAGNVDPTPATWSWTVEPEALPAVEESSPPVEEPPADTTPPDTTISSGPSGSTTATTASFSFSSTETGSTFECQLDSGSWAGCSSPKSLSGLTVGGHVFSVRAIDSAGNVDPTPATRSWTVEAEPQPEPEPGPTPEPEQTCTTTVSSVSAAQSSVASAAPGAVVCLADGSYGKVTLEASKAKPGVTLRAAHPGKATIAGASLQGENLTLARFVDTQGVTIQPGADGMTVEHNRITGGGEGIDGCPSSTTTCNDMKIIGNQLIGPFGEDGIHLNRYHDGDGDGIGVLIEGNEISGVRENGSHSDCLQTVWVGDHIVFRRNYLHDNRCQGFFVKDQASLGGVSGPIHGITVEDNLFVRNEEPCGAPLGPTECGQPMYFQVFGPYDGFSMKRNTIWGNGVNSIAAFREGTGPDTVISNNVIYRLWTDTNMSGVTLSENTLCMREGNWPSSRPGETTACSLSFRNPAADDYRLSSGINRGVDWAPAEVHYGP
ncbi:MAG: hypothetical protein ACTHN3_08730 [Solirubrobacterales bacterium]